MSPETPGLDIYKALNARDLWLYLAWQDIKLRYRRSTIGPFWITMSMGIFCLALAVVNTKLFHQNMVEYLPFLATGFVFWGFISGVIGEVPNIFVDASPYIKEMRSNPFTLIFRVIMRQLLTLLHNIIIIPLVYLYSGIEINYRIFFVIPGLFIVILNLFFFSIVMSLMGARYRDLCPITQSLLQAAFFITPITWQPNLIPQDSWLLFLNPLVFFLDLLRSPLLGVYPDPISWLGSIVTLFILGIVALRTYRKNINMMPFWV